MSVVRLGVTALSMAAAAVALLLLAPDPVAAARTLREAPEVAAGGGAESVVLALTGLCAWGTWAWGALGLVLTAGSALPGLPGALARGISRALLPQRLRAAAAVALGVGLAVAGPAAAAPAPSGPPDWPAAAAGPPGPPDWPADPVDPAGSTPGTSADPGERHVVVPGDSLWLIAAEDLARSGAAPTDGDVARAVTAWWAANADVIGADPDLVHPGQVLQAPPSRSDCTGGSR